MIKYFMYIAMPLLIVGCRGKERQKEYYENGKVKSVIIREGDKVKRIGYYESGRVESEGELLSDGHRTGPWVYYNEDGTLKAKGGYSDGLKEGTWNYDIGDSSYQVNWDIYLNRPIKINVPSSWTLKEELAPSVPLAGFSDSSNWEANFNIIVLDREGKPLDSIISETVRKGRENLAYSIEVLSIKGIEINTIKGKEVTQHLLAEGKSLIVMQYFLEQPETVYLLSFFVDENKRSAYDSIIKEIAYSFTPV